MFGHLITEHTVPSPFLGFLLLWRKRTEEGELSKTFHDFGRRLVNGEKNFADYRILARTKAKEP